jgi:hypothetical protein
MLLYLRRFEGVGKIGDEDGSGAVRRTVAVIGRFTFFISLSFSHLRNSERGGEGADRV